MGPCILASDRKGLQKRTMNTYYNRVRQLKLETIQDLLHHLKIHGVARYMVHDGETDWWWFANDRNRLLEEVFNSGSRVVLARKPEASNGSGEKWEVKSDLIPQVKGFHLETRYLSPSMNTALLADLFWTEFLNQTHDRFAYWDLDNPDNGFDAYLFYREMHETKAYLEDPVTC